MDIPTPPPEAVVPAPPPNPAPAVPARSALAIDFRPVRLWTRGPDAHLAFELQVSNVATGPVSGVRPVVVLASAGPDTAAQVAGFATQLTSLPGGDPFDLAADERRVVAGELTLPGDAMYVTEAAGRELIVPIALVGLTWRGGLSIASVSETFVVGAGDAGAAKLGPIWVDRPGQVFDRLDARRFTPGG